MESGAGVAMKCRNGRGGEESILLSAQTFFVHSHCLSWKTDLSVCSGTYCQYFL